MGWLRNFVNWVDPPKQTSQMPELQGSGARGDARNRLRLVLMHDRTQLSPAVMEQMRDELVDVISRYVEIDKDALELNLESESNTIALVANIPVVRAKIETTTAQDVAAAKAKAAAATTPATTATTTATTTKPETDSTT